MNERQILLWDFHNTLAAHHTGWPGEIIRALDRLDPGHGLTEADVRPLTRQGFPWQHPEVPHTELNAGAEVWWEALYVTLNAIFAKLGYDAGQSRSLAEETRKNFVETAQHEVFPETERVLQELKDAGWEMYVLSNHVPELEELLTGLGLRDYFETIFNSALIGYEKPNSGIFDFVRRMIGEDSLAIMIGDNPVADIGGATAAGIPAILLHTPTDGLDVKYAAKDITEIPEILARVLADLRERED